MNKNCALVAFIIFSISVLSAETEYTKRKNNYVREGPGSFYNLIVVLPENTPVDILLRDGNWFKIRLPKNYGWMAANCLMKKKAENSAPVNLENVWSSPKASRAGIAAAIRGWGEKYGKTSAGNIDKILEQSQKRFSLAELNAFDNELQQQPSNNRTKMELDDLDLGNIEYDAGLNEMKIGVGIAARIAEKGLVDDPGRSKYVNLIAASLAMNSDLFDQDFPVFILRDSKVNGFALPAGYIFVTDGVFWLCMDESELAAIIAHEIAHVIRKHGMQEMTKRAGNIQMDQAMAVLEDETGDKADETEEELESVAENLYDRAFANRLLQYELEADKIAAVLCARAGYDPFGLVRIAERVARIPKEQPDIFDPNYMAPNDAQTRYDAIKEFVNDEFSTSKPGATMFERYRR